MAKDYNIEVKSFGKVFPKKGVNARVPYEHQKDAMDNLDVINKSGGYSTMIVLPTGGGKTYTASMWLLKNGIDCNKKILWIAHRQMLLDQAAESFQNFAYSEVIPHIPFFQYRIISGASCHDRAIDIEKSDNLLIVSKDSIGRNLSCLDKWLDDEKEIFLVVDEAHHSTAKTYRKVIEYVKERVQNVKLIGLTATPLRTSDGEQGLLAKIYNDGMQEGKVIHGDIGITYQIGLKELINRRILSKPIFESYYTEEIYGENLGLNGWESIQRLDVLPDDVAGQMAESAARNKLIVNTYKAKQEEYGQTIVFAINVVHAVQLSALFNKAGIRSEFIVSDVKDAITGVRISREDNERKIEEYKSGNVQILVNVNILTEGIDLPQTKTVFLARPTVSTILMTQMIGRALRGEAAGGTSFAYIVSFVDNWNEHIAWVNPDSLFNGSNDFADNTIERAKHELRMIAVSKIEEFASLLDNSVDTAILEKVPFIQRIPIGMYAFNYLEEDGADCSYQVMVYDSTRKAYEDMMMEMPGLFKSYGCVDEYLPEDRRNKDTEFINFKKYYQRIYKGTGCKYKEWVSVIHEDFQEYKMELERINMYKDNIFPMKQRAKEIKNNYLNKHNLYIFGHSLDITDKDILRDLILNDNVHTTIFYHSKEELGRKIANLVKVIGQDELIKRTSGGNRPVMEFVPQSDMKIKAEIS